MGTTSASSIGNLLLFASLSASSNVSYLPFCLEYNINSNSNVKGDYVMPTDIQNWGRNAFNPSTVYSFVSNDDDRIQTIINFSRSLLENTKDIDSEFVDIVNEKFWDLI